MKNIFQKLYPILIFDKIIVFLFVLTIFVLFGNAALALTINLPDGYFANKYVTDVNVQAMAYSPDGSLCVKHWYKCDSHITMFNNNGIYETVAVIPLASGADQGPIVFDADGNLYIAIYPDSVYKIHLKNSKVTAFHFFC